MLRLVCLAVALGAGIASVVLFLTRNDGTPGQLTADSATAAVRDPETASAYLAAAASDLQVVTSSDYRSLDDELTAGLAVTTGAYQKSYRAALTGDAARAAQRQRIVQTFQTLKSGIGEIADDSSSAKVLVFGLQHVQSAAGAGTTAVTLTATVVRTGSRYLISALEVGGNAGLPPATAGVRAAAESAREDLARRAGGPVTAVALESADGDSVVLLMAASGTEVVAGQGRYEVSVQRRGGTWKVGAVTPVGGS